MTSRVPLVTRWVPPLCLVLAAAGTLTGCSSGNGDPTIKLDGVKACDLLTKAQLKSYGVSTVTLDTNEDHISVCEWGADPSAGSQTSVSVDLWADRDNGYIGKKYKTDPVDGLRTSFAMSDRDWELDIATGPTKGVISVSVLYQAKATRQLGHDIVTALR
jgi:hypothetical protein